MAEANERLKPEHQTPPMLDYREAHADRLDISGLQVFGGIICSAIMLISAVFFGILIEVANAGGSSSQLGIILIGTVILGINLWAIAAYRGRRMRGFAIGLWIGFGVAGLIEGVCFAANFR